MIKAKIPISLYFRKVCSRLKFGNMKKKSVCKKNIYCNFKA